MTATRTQAYVKLSEEFNDLIGGEPEDGQILIGSGGEFVLGNLTVGEGLLITEGPGTILIEIDPSFSTGSKIYEPLVIEGFNDNIAYVEGEPMVPNFLTTTDGDIMMGWGGDYAA